MKKILGVALAFLMVFALAGPAAAYFEKDELVVSAYNASEEMGIDLGIVGDRIDNGFIQLTATEIAQLSAYDSMTFYSENNDDATFFDLYFAVTDSGLDNTTAAGLNLWGAQGGFQGTMNHYNAAGTETVTEAYNTIGGYVYNMNMTGIVPGNYAILGTDPAIGEIDVADFLAGDSMYLYQLRVDMDGTSFVGGSYIAEITASAVPVPGAVWLLGSALLGVVGLRRKMR